MRHALIAALVILVCGAVLWGAFALDEYKKPVQTSVIEESSDGTLIVQMRESQGKDFVVFCPEERFADAFAEFAQFVDVDTPPLLTPGGPMVLALADFELSEDLKLAYRTLAESLRRHMPARVVLLSHEECIYYNSLAVLADELEAVEEKQRDDLQAARNVVETWLPLTEVVVYYAEKEGERLTFVRLTPDEGGR